MFGKPTRPEASYLILFFKEQKRSFLIGFMPKLWEVGLAMLVLPPTAHLELQDKQV